MSPYLVHYHPSVLKEDLPGLDPPIRRRIQLAIENRLTQNPVAYSDPLRQTLQGYRRLRVGDWRVIFSVEQSEVWILRIGHRREVYQQALRRKDVWKP